MVSFKTSILAFVLAQASAANVFMSSDCSDEKNQGSAECICQYPTNRDKKICQGPKWFGKPRDDVGIKIIGGEEVDPNVYPWFARATEGSDWGGK